MRMDHLDSAPPPSALPLTLAFMLDRVATSLALGMPDVDHQRTGEWRFSHSLIESK